MTNVWERNENGKLISQDGKIEIFDKAILIGVKQVEKELLTESEENKLLVLKETLKVLKEDLESTKKTLEISYTPLLHCELKAIQKGRACDGLKSVDIYADICCRKCDDPQKSFVIWRDTIDPTEKEAIASFIIKNSVPKIKRKESKGLQMLRGLHQS